MGLRLKLVLSYIAIIAFSFLLVAFFIDKHLEKVSLQEIKASLSEKAVLAAGQIPVDAVTGKNVALLGDCARDLSQKTGARLTVIDRQGVVLADSEKTKDELSRMENHLTRPEVRSALGGNIGIDTHRSNTLKIDMLYVATPLKEKEAVVGALRLALPLVRVDKTLFAIRKSIGTGFLFAIVLSVLFGSVVASRIVRPINSMIAASRKYSEGDFSRRVIFISKDELGELAKTLNAMAQELEGKIRLVQVQNQSLAAVFNSMIEGVAIIDRSGHIVSINSTIERTFHITKERAEGALFLEVIRNNEIGEIVNSVLKKGEPLSKETDLIYPVRKVLQANAVPVFDGGAVAGCLIVFHDITEMRALETMRSDFVANVSHELKTPLTSIKGFVETLLDGAIDDKEHGRNFLKIIQDHAGRLEDLVNDLLSLAHLESKEIVLERSPYLLKKQVVDIVSGFQSQLQKKGITVANELAPDFNIIADRHRIDQVLTNLIDNAIKFNKERGSIKIYSVPVAAAVKIIIEDSGAGIPVKDMTRIFERFYRVDRARSRQMGGTGLGLSIVKHIVELHGGSVGVESTEGLGSKFWFVLPI